MFYPTDTYTLLVFPSDLSLVFLGLMMILSPVILCPGIKNLQVPSKVFSMYRCSINIAEFIKNKKFIRASPFYLVYLYGKKVLSYHLHV
jgi:hypothetical protein